ncbi:MAG TPA: YdbL family protein [Myxococcota bacterium]|jgi:hypothetical protein
MRSAIRAVGLAIAAVLLSVAGAPSASADELDSAKAAGQVGERPDGYLGVVAAGAPPAVTQLVADVNAKRKLKYAEIAKQNGTAIDAVAALMGEKLIERTPAGQYVMRADGRWARK